MINDNWNWNWKAVNEITLLDTAAASGWLSDVDEGNSTQQRFDVVLLSDGGDDRPSVGSSPQQVDHSSPEQLQRQAERPKVDYIKGLLTLSTEISDTFTVDLN